MLCAVMRMRRITKIVSATSYRHLSLLSTSRRATYTPRMFEIVPSFQRLVVRNVSQTTTITANDVGTGDLIDYEGNLWRVMSRQTSRTAQGRAYIQTELKQLESGVKKDVRFRSEDSLERVSLETPAKLQVMYITSEAVAVMDAHTFEQADIPLDVLGDKLKYLQDGMYITVERYNGVPVVVTLPLRVTLLIESLDDASGIAKLTNGMTLRVPKHIKAGDRIIVDTRDGSYLGKESV